MLQIMTRKEHSYLHGSHPSSAEKMEKMQKRAQEVMATPEWKRKQAEVARKSVRTRVERGNSKSWIAGLKEKGVNPIDDPRVKRAQEKAAEGRRGIPSWCAGLTKETDERVRSLAKKGSKTKQKKNNILRQNLVSCFVCPICGKTFENTNECFAKYHMVACKRSSKLLSNVACKYCGKEFLDISQGKFLSHIGNCAKKTNRDLNHKVVSVRFVDNLVKVYDLTIEEYHNFALSAGVFVHNSDGVVGSVHNAIKNCQIPPDIEVMKELI